MEHIGHEGAHLSRFRCGFFGEHAHPGIHVFKVGVDRSELGQQLAASPATGICLVEVTRKPGRIGGRLPIA